MAVRRRSSTRCSPPLVSGNLQKHAANIQYPFTNTHARVRTLPRKHTTSMPSRLHKYAQTCTRYFVWANVTGAKKKVATLFLFSFSSFFVLSLSSRATFFLSFFLSFFLRLLAELQRERVHRGEREEKESEATAGSGQASSEGGAVISITVPFGNRDTSISNKTAKPRQIALTWGCNLSTPQHHPETSHKVEKQKAKASALCSFSPPPLFPRRLSLSCLFSLCR